MNIMKDIDINEIVKEVNKCDKKFDVKGKHPDVTKEPEQYYNIALYNFQMYLAGAICTLNGIEIDDYFYSGDFGTSCGPIGNTHKAFRNKSQLEWDTHSKFYDTNSAFFKCRFLTIVLTDVMCNLEELTEKRMRQSGTVFMFYENNYMFLTNIIQDVQRFVTLYLRSNDVIPYNIMLRMNQNLSYLKCKNPAKYNSQIKDIVRELKMGLNGSITQITAPKIPDDIAMTEIFRLSYMLSTNEIKAKRIPTLKHLEYKRSRDNLKQEIEKLGNSIIDTCKYKKRPLMYKAFNNARPLIYSSFKNVNKNFPLSVGLRALVYTKYMVQDKNIGKFIDKMIKG